VKRYLLDTNHLSSALQVRSPVRERILAERRLGSRFATCWPVLCELEAGLIQLASADRYRRMLSVIMREVRVWSLDAQVVKQYGIFFLNAKKAGRAIGSVDLMLAALTWKNTATLLTADQDFLPFSEIQTANWITNP
jgi:tRNA(fMet)-specific endonuclease VapC